MNSRNTIKKISFVFLFFASQYTHAATIVFDMEGVLIEKSRFSTFWQIGLSKFVGFYNPFSLETTLFNFFDQLVARRENTPPAMHKGRFMPQIMCDWQMGVLSPEECRALVEAGLEKHADMFTTNAQKVAVGSVAHYIFTPEKFGKGFNITKDAIKLVKRCKKGTDGKGKKNKVFILSNFDAPSFEYLAKDRNMKRILSRCDGVVISGRVGMMKPDRAIYQHLLDENGIDPDMEQVIFIDDRQENVDAAETVGMHGLLCKKMKYKSFKRKLRNLGVIS